MEREVHSIRTYWFDGQAPTIITGETPCEETYYDESGRIRCSVMREAITYYKYDPAGKLIRTVEDHDGLWRKIWTYSYDPDGNLLHLHSERRELGPHYVGKCANYHFYDPEFYTRDDDDQFEPIGYYTDEYYSWEEGGRIRRRELTIHSDQEVETAVMKESYDEDGMIRERWMGEIRADAPHLERFSYHKSGILKQAQYINRIEGTSGETVIHTTTEEYDENGKPLSCLCDGMLKYEVKYEYDKEGNWIRATYKDGMGFITQEIIRTVNY